MNRKALYSLSSSLMLIILSWSASAETDSALSCQAVPHLMNAYVMHHVTVRTISDTIKDRTSIQLMKQIDPARTLFLETEATAMRATIRQAFDKFKILDCKDFDALKDRIVARSKEVEDYVRKFLANPKYQLDKSVEITIDPDKRGYAKTAEQRNKTLEKLIHFRISNYLSSGTSLDEAKQNLTHQYELATKQAEGMERQELYSQFLDSYATALDPHSSYYSPEALEDFKIQMELSLEGIGVSLSSKDGFTIVEDIIPGGATDKTGVLEPKDKIIGVRQDGEDKPVTIIDKSLRDVVRLIRGKKGTKVFLTVLRKAGDKTRRFDTSIVRDKIDLAQQAAKLKFETRTLNGMKLKLAVIDLPSFYGGQDADARNAYADMKGMMKKIKKENVDGMLLDLSRNGGGLLIDAVRISGLFLKKGPVVATQDNKSRIEILRDKDSTIDFSGPMVVLTSRLSASASEILAGALKDYHRAVIIGDGHTFGKGSVQQVLNLKDGYGAIKVTTGMFFRPGGNSTQYTGVESDVVIPTRYANDEIGEKALDYSLPMRRVANFSEMDNVNTKKGTEHWRPVDADTVKKIATKSKARVAKNKEFDEIRKKLADAAKKKTDVVKLSEVEKEQKEAQELEKKEEKEKKSREEIVRELDAPQYNEALDILADLVSESKKSVLANVNDKVIERKKEN